MNGFDFLAQTLPEVRHPFATAPEWCVLIEVGLSGDLDPDAALETLFAAAHEAGLVPEIFCLLAGLRNKPVWHQPASKRFLDHPRDDPGGEPAGRLGLKP